jgi:hypothetical protein
VIELRLRNQNWRNHDQSNHNYAPLVSITGGTQLASLIARKFGWELLDHHLVDRIARIADLDVAKAARFDEQAARWWRGLRPPRINLADCCPYVSPRWLDAVDEAAHALATQLIQATAHSGECVVVGRGAQCLLQGRSDVFNVLVLRLASPGIGNRFSTLTEVLSVSLTMSRFPILAG